MCYFNISVSKWSKYVNFSMCVYLRPLFDLYLLLLDMMILPQKLFASTKSVTTRRRGRPHIHEGTMCFHHITINFNHFYTIYGVERYTELRGGV